MEMMHNYICLFPEGRGEAQGEEGEEGELLESTNYLRNKTPEGLTQTRYSKKRCNRKNMVCSSSYLRGGY